MSCPFCEVLTCYQRQVDRRLETGTFAMSEENAHLLLRMAAQIRNITRTTVRLVGQEAVPTMLCDLLDGLAEGLIEGLNRKLAIPFPKNGTPAPSSTPQRMPNDEPNPCQASPQLNGA
jgi:hypothetical protein